MQSLLPNLGVTDLAQLIMDCQYRVYHGPIERFPEFLRPDSGALSCIKKLKNWRDFHVAFRDERRRYHQRKPGDRSVTACYDDGNVIVSHGIHGLSASASGWLEEWAQALGISKNYVWFNSWAVKGASGIDWHFDYEDVIHFQIKGDKLLKLLRTPNTVGADRQMKTFERVLMEQENFDDAHEEIVTAGTITVIPRGVWHWSESKSDESFAVSLCMGTPSRAEILSKALFKRLRLVDQNRMPLFGSNDTQINVMRSLLDASRPLLQSIDGRSVALEESRFEITHQIVDRSYFYLGLRANVSLSPLRMLVDGQAIAIPAEEDRLTVARAVCKLGHGFTRHDLAKYVPCANSDLITEVLSSLTKVGFLDFIDMEDDRASQGRFSRA